MKKCDCEWCERNENNYNGRFIMIKNNIYCSKHYQQIKIHGHLLNDERVVFGNGINNMYRGWAKETKENNRIYSLWHHMIRRCYNKNSKDYKYYGEKNIKVCDRWLLLSNFVEDIKLLENYDKWLENKKRYELDKDIKSDGENKCYCLENCLFELKSKNISESNKRMSYDFTKTKEHKIKQRKTSKTKRKIIGIDEVSKKIIVINSIRSSNNFGFNPSCIWGCCNKKRKTHKGYKWYYLDEYKGGE